MNISVEKSFYETQIETLGFKDNEIIFTSNDNFSTHKRSLFHLNKEAIKLNVSGFYYHKQIVFHQTSLIYFYDFTQYKYDITHQKKIVDFSNKIWNNGKIVFAVFIFGDTVKIVNCTLPNSYESIVFIDELLISQGFNLAHFATHLKTGVLWQNPIIKPLLKSDNFFLDDVSRESLDFKKFLQKLYPDISNQNINSIIQKIISSFYFAKHLNLEEIDTTLRVCIEDLLKGHFKTLFLHEKWFDLLEILEHQTKEKWFSWDGETLDKKENFKQKEIAEYFERHQSKWQFYRFNIISSSTFIALIDKISKSGEQKEKHRLSEHFKQFLINQSFPTVYTTNLELDTYKVLDFACDSPVFLTFTLHKLIESWQIKNNFDQIAVAELNSILSNLHGINHHSNYFELVRFCLKTTGFEYLNSTNLNFFSEIQLPKDNLIEGDFLKIDFTNKEFDFILGNPLFIDKTNNNLDDSWETKWIKTEIPKGHISLNYVSKTFKSLKSEGLTGLAVDGLNFFYQQPSAIYNEILLLKHNIFNVFNFSMTPQVFDTEANELPSLFALLGRNEKPDCCMNLSHYVIKDNISNNENLFVDVDSYDLNFINKQTEVYEPYIWKNDLFGGGRFRNIFRKLEQRQTLRDWLETHQIEVPSIEPINEGNSGKIIENLRKQLKSIPQIDFSFEKHKNWYAFYIDVVTAQLLIRDNAVFNYKNFLELPFIEDLSDFSAVEFELVTNYKTEDNSFVTNNFDIISQEELTSIINKFSDNFLDEVNFLYCTDNIRFRLSGLYEIDTSLIAVVYRYSDQISSPELLKINSQEETIPELKGVDFLKMLTTDKIIRIYPSTDTIVLIKPKLFKYWDILSSFKDAAKYI